MRIAMFYHSIVSDWNHGNAHFLRGVVRELLRRGHEVRIYEEQDAWSRDNLLREQGPRATSSFEDTYPDLEATFYDLREIDLHGELEGVELVVAHEWNPPALLERLVRVRRDLPEIRLLFHDTHHRAVSAASEIEELPLEDFDGALLFGRVLQDVYQQKGWCPKTWVWHEAADTSVFRPLPGVRKSRDVVWIGNWGDDERSRELERYLIRPIERLALRAQVRGVRFPRHARRRLEQAGIDYDGWIANTDVPRAFAESRMTVHVPRRPYVRMLPGIPTIRVFEALACSIPLVCSPWEDAEGLFVEGRDYLVARNPRQMREAMRHIMEEPAAAAALAEHGRRRVLSRHTCRHRVDELMEICRELGLETAPGRSEHFDTPMARGASG